MKDKKETFPIEGKKYTAYELYTIAEDLANELHKNFKWYDAEYFLNNLRYSYKLKSKL